MASITKQGWYKTFVRILTTVIAVLFLANTFLKNAMINNVLMVLFIILFICGFLIMNKVNRIVCAVLTVVGAYLLYKYGVDFAGWRTAVNKGAATIVLIYFAPILALPFFYKPYQAEIKNVCAKYISNPTVFILISAVASFAFGFYMSMAALPVVYALLADTSKEYKCHKQFVMALIAGNSLVMCCAPGTGAGVILPATGISFTQFMGVGTVIALIIIVATALLNGAQAKKDGAESRAVNPETVVNWGNIAMLVFLFVLLSGIIICIDKFTNISLLAGVSMLALPFAVVMAVVQGKTDVFTTRMKKVIDVNMLKNPNTMTILGIAGFAGEGLKRAEIIKTILSVFSSTQALYLLFPLLIMVIAVIAAMIGVHPMAMASTLASVLTAEVLCTTTAGLAMILGLGWAFGLTVSPFSAVSNLASSSSGIDVWEITSKKALPWAIVAIVIATVAVDLITIMGI